MHSFYIRALFGLAILLLTHSSLSAQAQQQPMGGVSTGSAVTYTSKRTVGIVDANAPTVFENVTDQTAL
jgi:hypothetical protein